MTYLYKVSRFGTPYAEYRCEEQVQHDTLAISFIDTDGNTHAFPRDEVTFEEIVLPES